MGVHGRHRASECAAGVVRIGSLTPFIGRHAFVDHTLVDQGRGGEKGIGMGIELGDPQQLSRGGANGHQVGGDGVTRIAASVVADVDHAMGDGRAGPRIRVGGVVVARDLSAPLQFAGFDVHGIHIAAVIGKIGVLADDRRGGRYITSRGERPFDGERPDRRWTDLVLRWIGARVGEVLAPRRPLRRRAGFGRRRQ